MGSRKNYIAIGLTFASLFFAFQNCSNIKLGRSEPSLLPPPPPIGSSNTTQPQVTPGPTQGPNSYTQGTYGGNSASEADTRTGSPYDAVFERIYYLSGGYFVIAGSCTVTTRPDGHWVGGMYLFSATGTYIGRKDMCAETRSTAPCPEGLGCQLDWGIGITGADTFVRMTALAEKPFTRPPIYYQATANGFVELSRPFDPIQVNHRCDSVSSNPDCAPYRLDYAKVMGNKVIAVKTVGPYTPSYSLETPSQVSNVVYNLPSWSEAGSITASSWNNAIKPQGQVGEFLLVNVPASFPTFKTRVYKWNGTNLEQVGPDINERLADGSNGGPHLNIDTSDSSLVHFYEVPNQSSAGTHTSTYRIASNGLTWVRNTTAPQGETILAISGNVVVSHYRSANPPYSEADPFYELRVTVNGNRIPVQQPPKVRECKRFWAECHYNNYPNCAPLHDFNWQGNGDDYCASPLAANLGDFYPRIIAAQVAPNGVILFSTHFGGIYTIRLQ